MRPTIASAPMAADERCVCGNLVAKITPAGVEILCRRCKRTHRIPWSAAQGDERMKMNEPR